MFSARTFVLIASLAILASLLSGCSGQNSATQPSGVASPQGSETLRQPLLQTSASLQPAGLQPEASQTSVLQTGEPQLDLPTAPGAAPQTTPTLSITDIPATPTPDIQTATLPFEATSLAEAQAWGSPAAMLPDTLLLSELIGRAVRGPEGHHLGSLAGLIIARSDPAGPLIHYALLAASPDVGLPPEQNLVFIPWPLVASGRDPVNHQVVLQVGTEPATLAQAPAYSPGSLPAIHLPDWDVNLVTYWRGTTLPVTGSTTSPATPTAPASTEAAASAEAPAATEAPASTEATVTTEAAATNQETTPTFNGATPTPHPDDRGALLVRGKLANLRVTALDGSSIGTVEDFVIESQSGMLAYLLLAYEGRLVPVPLSQVTWNAPPEDSDVGVLQMSLPQNLLLNAPAFTSLDNFMATPPGWEQATDQYWDTVIQ